ncbi:MAG: IS110 family transposase, partial [Flavobacteriales bacterium]|nr:IS110 family transposase [Flavobacteriales bacterium]
LSYRERLVKSKVALQVAAKELKAHTDQSVHKTVVESSDAHIRLFQASIRQLDKQLEQLISSDESLLNLYSLITSVKGIGSQIAAYMLVYTHGFTNFANWRKFSCYCGLAPFEYRSGTSIRGKTKVSYLGNRKLKALIGNGASSAIQHDQELANYYRRKLKEGKHKMLVQNAIKNKLISRAFAVVKRGTPFVELYKHAA